VRYQFLHIGKTGGTLVRRVLRSLPEEHRLRFHLLGHVSLSRAIEARPEMPVFFSVRRPETLFVSAFNSRLRAGQPTYNRPWTAREHVAFSKFKSPNQLAESLAASDSELKASAEQAMWQINHVRQGLRWYLRSVEFLEQHRQDIVFVMLQEHLEQDLHAFARWLDVPLELARVPASRRFHESLPEDETVLSEAGLANIRRWYRPHQEIYDWCADFRARLPDGA
jgi:hypothetical protein